MDRPTSTRGATSRWGRHRSCAVGRVAGSTWRAAGTCCG